MRVVIVTSLSLVLNAGGALAQAGTPPSNVSPPPSTAAPANPKSPAADDKTAKARAKENIADCMRLWDAATHMTKQQWARTCERIQTRLENLSIESLEPMRTGLPKKRG
jgi:hypothetical protein